MALGIYFAQSGLDVEKYNECIKRLKKAGAAHPAGRSYHSCFGPPDKHMIFDVWTSQAAFDRFGKARHSCPFSSNWVPNPGRRA